MKSLSYLPRVVAQLYRSVRTAQSLRAVHRHAASGGALFNSKAIANFAARLDVDPYYAESVYLGTFSSDPFLSTRSLASLQNNLRGVSSLKLLFPETAREAGAMFRQARQVHKKQVHEDIRRIRSLSRDVSAQNRSIRRMISKRDYAGAKEVSSLRADNLKSLAGYSSDLALLNSVPGIK